MLVGTTTATAMAFAFAIFGKKRRDEEPPAPDEVLQAQAARGSGTVPGGEVLGVVRAPIVAAPIDAEAGMPRWRRPSLIEARKADPSRMVGSTGTMSSSTARSPPSRPRAPGDLATASCGCRRPDELRSGRHRPASSQGDEVQLLERPGRTGSSSARMDARAGSKDDPGRGRQRRSAIERVLYAGRRRRRPDRLPHAAARA
jgi:hypothetical protein